ncbi:MAG TPA: nodulation protein NfeD [Moorella mulderi]|nr:nodulation protein NfeD [Moorella mulderi]
MKFKKILIWALLLFLLGPLCSFSQPQETGSVYLLRVEGPIVPVVANYIKAGIREAAENRAQCVLIELSTPGGLYHTTQDIVSAILNSPVPVVVYVAPAGAWAGSAGTFITIAAHVAAMAPGSRIGAAHPVPAGGSEMSPTMEKKVAQDAAAWVRSISHMRGRNPEEAEKAVLESKSFTDHEALENRLVDLVASSREDLLRELQDRNVVLADKREVKLNTAGAPIRKYPMNPLQRFLFKISEPNIAYLLLTLGGIGLMAELYHPGAIFPGVAGSISLLLGLYAMGSLDAQFGGVLLVLLGLGLLAGEAFVTTHGVLALGGIIAFILGSLMLFSDKPPSLRVSPWTIGWTSAFLAGFVIFLIAAVIKGQRRRVVTGKEGLIGSKGVAITSLNPEGFVFVEGERWKAVSEEPVIAGDPVVVVEVEDLLLKVKPRKNKN